MQWRPSPCVFLRRHTSKRIICSKYCSLTPADIDLIRQTWPGFLTTRCSAELEMTVNMLIQVDKLVQLIESPVFTCESDPALYSSLH